MLQPDRSSTAQSVEEFAEENSFGLDIGLSQADRAVDRTMAQRPVSTASASNNTGETNVAPGHPRTENVTNSTLLVDFPPTARIVRRQPTLHPLQEWEGYVVDIDDNTFVARLIDVSAGQTHESEEATIPLEELSDYDAANLTIGGIFRWVIGYERSPEGTQKRVSQVVFRDLPRMSEGDFRRGREWAKKMVPVLNP